MKTIYRQQGDVLIYANESVPKECVELKTNVLQEGGHTGHAHRLFGDGFTVFEEPKTKVKYLHVVDPVDLRHEEHKAFKIEPGEYRIGIVREYDHFDEESRSVRD